MSQSNHSRSLRLSNALSTLYPHVRYLALGIILAWIYLQVDFGAWRSSSDPSSAVASMSNVWFFSGSLAIFVVTAIFPTLIERLLKWRAMTWIVLGVSVLGTAALIIAGPLFYPEWIVFPSQSALFICGSLLLGMVGSIVTLRIAGPYCKLEAGEVLFFTLLSELVVFVLFTIFTSYDNFVFVEGSPSISGITALCFLPAIAWKCAGLPARSAESQENANKADLCYAPDESGTAALRQAFKELNIGLPKGGWHINISLWRLFIAVLIFSATVALVRTCFANAQITAHYQISAQIVMLIRVVCALGLLIGCISILKRVQLEKFYLVASTGIALVMALIAFFGTANTVLALIAFEMFFLLDLLMWCLVIMAAQSDSSQTLRLVALGRSTTCLGMLIGYAVGGSLGSIASPLDNTTFCAFLLIAVLLSSIIVFNENRLLQLLKSWGKDKVDVSSTLEKQQMAASAAPNPTMGDKGATGRAARWSKACEAVGNKAMLSEREQVILRQLADNRTPKDTADYLCISLNTVRTHTRNIYAKLGVHSRDELIVLIKNELDSARRQRDR